MAFIALFAGSYDRVLDPAILQLVTARFRRMHQLFCLWLPGSGLNAEETVGVNEGGQLSLNKLQIVCDDGDGFITMMG